MLNIHLLSRCGGGSVDVVVKTGDVILEGPVVPEGPPLGVDTHAALVALHQVDVPQLLHVARVGTCAWEDGETGRARETRGGTALVITSHTPPLQGLQLGAQILLCFSVNFK